MNFIKSPLYIFSINPCNFKHSRYIDVTTLIRQTEIIRDVMHVDAIAIKERRLSEPLRRWLLCQVIVDKIWNLTLKNDKRLRVRVAAPVLLNREYCNFSSLLRGYCILYLYEKTDWWFAVMQFRLQLYRGRITATKLDLHESIT